jgi:hypothetical protein
MANSAELAAHREMLTLLKDPLWLVAAAEANQAVAGLTAGAG